jgi:hypothetical protein
MFPPAKFPAPGCGAQFVMLAGAVKSGFMPLWGVGSVDADPVVRDGVRRALIPLASLVGVTRDSAMDVVEAGFWVGSGVDVCMAPSCMEVGIGVVLEVVDDHAPNKDVNLGRIVDGTPPGIVKSRRFAHAEGSSPFQLSDQHPDRVVQINIQTE